MSSGKYNNKSIQYQLHFAQCKLLSSDIPLQLRAVSYIRIGCSAMRKYQAMRYSSQSTKTPCLSLLKSLSEQEHAWWNSCRVSCDGSLESTNLAIHQLLHPLNVFIQEQLEPVAA